MRMRKRHNLAPRMEQCREYLEAHPQWTTIMETNTARSAQKVSEGTLDLKALYSASSEELLASLKQVAGVGTKVAGCIGLFAYGRTGLAPVDVWIGRVIDCVYGGCDPFAAYGDAAGIMQQYIFHYALAHKKEFSGR